MNKLTPNLDTVEFDRLVSDGRGLIPAYAPEWTDHNLHDPGITLIDLIAYLVDTQVYRIGFVGDSLKRAFTRLLGVAPRQARPAQMLIWPKGDIDVFDFERGTKIDSPDLIDATWTLDADLQGVRQSILSIHTVTSDDPPKSTGIGLIEGRDPLPIAAHATGGPRSLEFELSDDIKPLADGGFVSLGALFDANPQKPAPDHDPDWDPVTLEQWDGGGFWRPLDTHDLTYGLRQDGVILFRPRADGAAKRFRIRLDAGFRPGPVTLTRLGLNVLPATEGVSLGETYLADTTGLPNQLVPFKSDDLVEDGHLPPPFDAEARPLKILINAGGIQHEWKRVETFDGSNPDHRHYRITEDGLLFGNGLNGALPPKLGQISHGPLRRTCGADGGVQDGLFWRIAGKIYGENLTASTRGRNRDGLEDLLTAARQVATERKAHLTGEDIKAHLLNRDFGLARVDVLLRRRPGREAGLTNGNRTVLVLPERDPNLPPPAPDHVLLAQIKDSLSQSLLIGERCHVSPPIYRAFRIKAHLLVEADADLDAIQTEARAILGARFWDLPRRPDQPLSPSTPGRPVTIGAIETLLARISPVISVLDATISENDEAFSAHPMILEDREFAMLEDLSLQLTRFDERAGT